MCIIYLGLLTINFTETVSVSISLTAISLCFINGNCPSLSICPADQRFGQTKNNCSLHHLLPLCRTWWRYQMLGSFCGCLKWSNKKYCFFLWTWIFIIQTQPSPKDTVRLMHLFIYGLGALYWTGRRMSSAAQFANWTVHFFFPDK